MATSESSIEDQIHQSLHKNLYLLSKAYPTSKEFNECFKEGMFFKANKTGFEQVVYFLLNALNPEKCKENIIWPLYDNKSAAQFRTDVRKYLNSLNDQYDDARIPSVLCSHLITPGGIKVVKILWKLSELVLIEYLNRVYESQGEKKSLLLPMTADEQNPKQSEKMCSDFSKLVDRYISEINEKQNERSAVINQLIEQVNPTVEAIDSLSKEIDENKIKLDNIKKTIEERNFDLERDPEDFTEDIEFLKNVEANMKKCFDLAAELVDPEKKKVLKYDPKTFTVPESLKDVCKWKDQLPLIEFLKIVNSIIEKIAKNFVAKPVGDLDELCETVEKITQNLDSKIVQLEIMEIKINDMKTEYEKVIDEFNQLISDPDTSGIDHSAFLPSPPIEFDLPARPESDLPVTTAKKTFFRTPFTGQKKSKPSTRVSTSAGRL